MSTSEGKLNSLDVQTFSAVMGQAVWLMTMSKGYRDLPIRDIENVVSAALLLKQFKLYSKGKQPVAFLTWASVSDEVKDRLDTGKKLQGLSEWRSGENIVVIDCVSPFNAPDTFIHSFMKSAQNAISKSEVEFNQ